LFRKDLVSLALTAITSGKETGNKITEEHKERAREREREREREKTHTHVLCIYRYEIWRYT
jgi:hypothetical protein